MSTVNLGSISVSTGPPAFDGARCDLRGCSLKAETQLTFRARRQHACERHQDEVVYELAKPEAERLARRHVQQEVGKILDKAFGRSRTIKL